MNLLDWKYLFINGKAENFRKSDLYLYLSGHRTTQMLITECCHFRFLVFKTIAAMQWASTNLWNQTYYSLGDDDFKISLDKILNAVNETLLFAEKKSGNCIQ